jgi:hypothetical protein
MAKESPTYSLSQWKREARSHKKDTNPKNPHSLNSPTAGAERIRHMSVSWTKKAMILCGYANS